MQGDNLKNRINMIQKCRIEKVVVSIGVGEAVNNKNVIKAASADLMAITGQKPKITQARVSIAGFKVREGQPIGLMVTLRGKRMRDFLKKLFTIVLSRLRDFHGVSRKGFDGHGNFNLGVPEQIVFPEIDYEKIDKIRGLQITIVTNTNSDKEAEKLLENLGMPFEKLKVKS